MTDPYERQLIVGQERPKVLNKPLSTFEVDSAQGLIGEQYSWPGEQGAAQCNALAFSTGQVLYSPLKQVLDFKH